MPLPMNRVQPPQRRQIARTVSLPAPVGGLNARDALAEMPETDAALLDNWFPNPSYVAVRNGYSAWVAQSGVDVKSLMCYSPPSGSRKLFAAAGGKIYDVTASGALPAASVSGQTSDWWQHLNVQAGGGQYLMCANGADSIELFNGTTWQAVTGASAPIAITGVTTSNIIHLNTFKGRVFLIEKNSMRAWFLPLNSVGGAASQLDFSMYTKLGGYLMAMVTWTLDNAGGIDERAAFITSEGEVLLFTGTDPSFASSWFLQGSFRIGRPVGRRCYARIGADVAVISADGVYPMSQALLTDRSQRQDALSDKIVNLVNTDVQLYSGNQGWQPMLHPIGNKFLVNVPATNGTYQYVQNTVHGAWSRFTGWAASCFELFGDQLMMGTVTGVYWADTGTSDNGANINVAAVQAASKFGADGVKQFTMARPILYSNAKIRPAFQVNVDYDLTAPSNTTSFFQTNFTPWGSPWGSPWSSASLIRRDWQGVSGVGMVGAPAIAFGVKNAIVNWQSTDVMFMPGGPI